MSGTVTVDADDLRAINSLFAAAVQTFGTALAAYPGFERAVQACGRLAVAVEQAEMPEDPVGANKSMAITLHEMLRDFMDAEFERSEAFRLVEIQAATIAQMGLARALHG